MGILPMHTGETPVLRAFRIIFGMESHPNMELIDTIKQRRSVKYFDPHHTMPDEELRHLLSLAMLSPSSFNMQHWRFIAVRDAGIKEQLCEASWYQRQVRDASLVLVIACDLSAHEGVARCWEDAPAEVQQKMVPMIQGFYRGQEQLIRDEGARSAGLVGMTLMLLAVDLGYDSCPLIGFDAKKVMSILNLPEEYPPMLMITIGKALKPARPRPGLLRLEEAVRLERFDGEVFK